MQEWGNIIVNTWIGGLVQGAILLIKILLTPPILYFSLPSILIALISKRRKA